jgi:hypothetical protein
VAQGIERLFLGVPWPLALPKPHLRCPFGGGDLTDYLYILPALKTRASGLILEVAVQVVQRLAVDLTAAERLPKER